MKSPEIFKHYIWMTNTIRHAGRITLNELNERWIKTEMSGGLSMPRTTFNRHRKAIEDIFDICIGCQRCGDKYLYFIENEELLKNNSLHLWMLDFLSIGNLLMESSALKDRIILENIPAGKDYLQPIIDAMKIGRKLRITYRKFGKADAHTFVVEPYAIKVFKQRWYLLAKNHKRPEPTIYALDRMLAVEETAESFEYPSDFNTELFFQDYYGVLCVTTDKPETIVMDIGTCAVGYGYEYAASTMDRIRLAALAQSDADLQMPILAAVCNDTWGVKESSASEEDEPTWGCREERAISMEIATAAADLVGGADAVVLRHPASVAAVKKFINELI